MRANDIVARYGGDEFVVLMPDTDLAAAQLVAERVVAGVRGQRHQLADGTEGSVACSAGLALYPDDGRTATRLLRTADAAMYRVKRAGGDAVSATGVPQPVAAAIGPWRPANRGRLSPGYLGFCCSASWRSTSACTWFSLSRPVPSHQEPGDDDGPEERGDGADEAAQMYAWLASPTIRYVTVVMPLTVSVLMKNSSSRKVMSAADADAEEPLQHP